MKRFLFPLETARRWRAEQASLEELKLQRIRAVKESLEMRKIEIRTHLTATESSVLSQSVLVPQELEILDSFRIYSQGSLRSIDQEAQRTDAQIVAQCKLVVNARQRFEVLDRLRIKARNEWAALAAKEEENLASELHLAKKRITRAQRRSSLGFSVTPGLPLGDPR